LKIELEKILLIVFLVIIIPMTLYFVTPVSDNYWDYTIAKEIIRDPGFLWQSNLTSGTVRLLSGSDIFQYPPLLHFSYAFLFLLQLPPTLLDVISIIIVCFFLYKMEKRAIPFLFLSFLFVRISVEGGIDIFLLALVSASIYFFESKPEISGIFAGLTPVVKGTGFLFFGSWLIAIILFKRKEVFKKDFYKSKYLIAVIIAILIFSTWYLRNFLLFKGDIGMTLVGYNFSAGENWAHQGIQAQQPERSWFDTTGYYPLPIDILFYIGIAFTVFGLYKKKELKIDHVFIFIYAFAYFAVQALNVQTLMTIRHYLPIFPLLAIQVSRGIPEKYLKFVYVGCLIFLIAWMFILPKYAWNQMDSQMNLVCNQIKNNVDFEPVYVNAYQGWYTVYKCNLNATSEIDSKWTLNFDQGQLYLTNKTNITGV
jgi:hypothetical protein